MISKENFHFYLRYLVKLCDKKPIRYDEIPKEFQDFFTLPSLSQALNISIRPPPPVNYSKVEKYLDETTFNDFDSLVDGIKNTFDSSMDKLYAIYYYITHTMMYDYERFEQEDRDYLADDVIFRIKKGVCADYSQFFIHLAKKAGITNKIIIIKYFTNIAKASGYDSFNPPKTPDENKKLLHASVVIEINGEKFLSEPTWAAGSKEDGAFKFIYKKSYFLLPYYKALIDHFPYEGKNGKTINCPYTWAQYISINTPNFDKELSLESNPYKRVTVTNGFFEMQFSYIQSCESPYAVFKILKDKNSDPVDSILYNLVFIDKDIPSHNYSIYPDKKRNRYKLLICFPEKGIWSAGIYDPSHLFTTYFDVQQPCKDLPFIPVRNKEENGFYPITPQVGLTKIDKGTARIRFAVKEKRSPLLIELYKIKKGTFERENDSCLRNCHRLFTVEISDDIVTNQDKSSGERLVEDWVLIDFPEKGRWEVYIYFKNDIGSYYYGCKYFFDVSDCTKDDKYFYSIADLPKERKFIPLKPKNEQKVMVKPSSSVVVLTDTYSNFHVLSQNELKVYFTNVKEPDSGTIWPTLISAKEVKDDNEIIDREYSVIFPSYGHFELFVWDKECVQYQQYFVIDFEQPDESYKEKKMMNYLVDQLKFPQDYTADIPKIIEKRVDQMLIDAKQEKEENKSESDNDDDDDDELDFGEQEEISSLMNKASKLENEKEMLNKKFEEMKKKKDQLKLEFVRQIEELKKEWARKEKKEKKEKIDRSKMRKIELDNIEKEEKEKSEQKMADLRNRIAKIEEQLNIDPEKRNELVNLHKQLLKEEENEMFVLSSRRQKKQDEFELEEKKFDELERQDNENKMRVLQQKKDEFEQKLLNENQENESTSIKVPEQETKVKESDESNQSKNKTGRSKCCLLI